MHDIGKKTESIKKIYDKLYPNSEKSYEKLIKMVERYAKKRSKALKALDEAGTNWISSGDTVGMMLYVDLFSGRLINLVDHIDYFERLGVTLIHLMPILKPREGENDGGYAVSSYREIDPRVGTISDLEKVIKSFHKKGIRLCIDYVVNHTSDDHEWAIKAKSGESKYQNYYFMYEDASIPKRFELYMNQVFPNVAPGNFTFNEETGKWVMTTFYPFQWDLNYQNPEVLHEMIENMLFLANKGIDMIRLDAIPYMWKAMGTSCRNLPEVNNLLAIFRAAIDIVAPSTALLGEAIVAPETIVKYFGSEDLQECHVLYNASYMVEIWNAIATRDARHIAEMPRFDTPSASTWINYARCHDDIGWGLSDGRIRQLGFDPHAHKMFLIDFYHGILKDSFSKGELYEFDPVSLDARNSGTLASLVGLEKAIENKDRYARELAIKRIELIHTLILFRRGMPMLYSGDEIATLNDYTYKNHLEKGHDSRWLHRPTFNWASVDEIGNHDDPKTIVFEAIRGLIALRKSSYEGFEIAEEHQVQFSNHHVLGVVQILIDRKNNETRHSVLLFNFSEDRQWIYANELRRFDFGGFWRDVHTGRQLDFEEERLMLGPYEYFLLQK